MTDKTNVKQKTHDHYIESGQHLVSHDITYANITKWLKQGWQDITKAPIASLFYGVMVAIFVIAIIIVFRTQLWLIFIIATAFLLLTPFLAVGLYAIAHQLEQGKKPDLIKSMLAWKDNTTEFALYLIALIVIIGIWSVITPLLAAIMQSDALLIIDTDDGPLSFLMTAAGINFLVFLAIITAVMGAFIFAISVVTIPILFKNYQIGAIGSMVLSFQVVMENKKVMAVWGIVVGGLILFGLLTLGLAFIIIMPLLGYASWHAANDLVTLEES